MARDWRFLVGLLTCVDWLMAFKTIPNVVGRTSGGSGGRERALAQLSGFEYNLVSLVEFAFRGKRRRTIPARGTEVRA